MIPERNYLVFVLPAEYNENFLEYSDLISWSHENLKHENVLKISMDEIYELKNIWNIVNEINDSMIGPYEDGSVLDQKRKIMILQKLIEYKKETIVKREKELLLEIIRLFEIAIKIDHSVNFLF